MKWWKRVLYHLLDLSLANANILYNRASQKPMNHMDFRLSVAKALLEGHVATYQQRNSSTSSDLPLRLNSRCFLEQIPKETQYGGLHQCVVCRSRGRRSQTRYRCKNCLVALHVEGCFELFHTKLDYSK